MPKRKKKHEEKLFYIIIIIIKFLYNYNAIVERVFSHVTYVKNKNSNSLSIKMLDAILRVRLTLKLKGKCCTDLEITPKMLELFTKAMYVNEEELEDLSSFI